MARSAWCRRAAAVGSDGPVWAPVSDVGVGFGIGIGGARDASASRADLSVLATGLTVHDLRQVDALVGVLRALVPGARVVVVTLRRITRRRRIRVVAEVAGTVGMIFTGLAGLGATYVGGESYRASGASKDPE